MKNARVNVAVIVAVLAMMVALCLGCGSGVAQSSCHRLCSELGACYPRADMTDCHQTCDRAPTACANDLDLADSLDACTDNACGAMLVCAWVIAGSRPECVEPGSSLPQS